MMKLHSLGEKEASPRQPRGYWYELAPGPDDGRYWSPDGAFFWMDEWEYVGEPIIGERLPGYDRHVRVTWGRDAFGPVLGYVDDVVTRLRTSDEPEVVHVLLPEICTRLRWEVVRGFPAKAVELADDLEGFALWVKQALRRWHSVTFVGL